MRHATTSYAASLSLARDRARRDHQAADARRRLHVQNDAPVAQSRRSLRPVVASLVAGLHVRRARSTS